MKATNLPQDNSEDNRKYEVVSGPFGFKKAVKLDKNVAGGPQVTNLKYSPKIISKKFMVLI